MEVNFAESACNTPPPYGDFSKHGAAGAVGGGYPAPSAPGYETLLLGHVPGAPGDNYGVPPQGMPRQPINPGAEVGIAGGGPKRPPLPPRQFAIDADVHWYEEYQQGGPQYSDLPPEVGFVGAPRQSQNPSPAPLAPTAPLASITPSVPELSVAKHERRGNGYVRFYDEDREEQPAVQEPRGANRAEETQFQRLEETRGRDYGTISRENTGDSRNGGDLRRRQDICQRIEAKLEKYRKKIKKLSVLTFCFAFTVMVVGILGIIFPPSLTIYFSITEAVVGIFFMISAVYIFRKNDQVVDPSLAGAITVARVAGFISILFIISCTVTVIIDTLFLKSCRSYPQEYYCPDPWAGQQPINYEHATFRVTSQGIALAMSVFMTVTFHAAMHVLDKRRTLHREVETF